MAFSREDIFNCHLAENSYVFEDMDDYLTMLSVVSKITSQAIRTASGVTLLQYRILSRIRHDGSSTASMLAQEMRLMLSTVSSAVSTLSRANMIRRVEDSSDGRMVRLMLTALGRKAVTRANLAVIHATKASPVSLAERQKELLLMASSNVIEAHSNRSFVDSDGNPAFVIANALFITRQLLADRLKELGLVPRDYRVMLAVETTPCRTTVSEIAQHMLLKPADITSCLNNLSARRLITRERCPDNRRLREVALTRKGAKSLRELTPRVFEALYAAGPSSDETLQVLTETARMLIGGLRSQNSKR